MMNKIPITIAAINQYTIPEMILFEISLPAWQNIHHTTSGTPLGANKTAIPLISILLKREAGFLLRVFLPIL